MSMAATTRGASNAPREGTSPAAAARITAKDLGLLILRLTLGLIFFAHGAQKALGWFGGSGLEATVTSIVALASRGRLPTSPSSPSCSAAWRSCSAFSAAAALGLSTLMIVAMVKVHLLNGFFMNWGAVGGRYEGFEYNLALLAMTLTVLTVGPGHLTLVNGERALLRRVLGRKEA